MAAWMRKLRYAVPLEISRGEVYLNHWNTNIVLIRMQDTGVSISNSHPTVGGKAHAPSLQSGGSRSPPALTSTFDVRQTPVNTLQAI